MDCADVTLVEVPHSSTMGYNKQPREPITELANKDPQAKSRSETNRLDQSTFIHIDRPIVTLWYNGRAEKTL